MTKERKPERSAALVISLITIALYLPILGNDFVLWDDDRYVSENIHIRSLGMSFFTWAFTDLSEGFWQPLSWLFHAIDYAAWGANPMGHHLTSILLHAANTGLVIFLVIALLDAEARSGNRKGDRRTILLAAGATGALFGIHPLQVEAVAWATAKHDLLFSFWFLLSVLSYVRSAAGSRDLPSGGDAGSFLNPGYRWSFLWFVLALCSKPTAVVLPAVLLILDWYPLQKIRSWRTAVSSLLEKMPFVLLGLIVSIATLIAHHAQAGMVPLDRTSLDSRLLVAAQALLQYLAKSIAPFPLLPFYPYPQQASLATVTYGSLVFLVLAITAAGFVLARKRPYLLAAWLWFVVILLPVLGLIQVREYFMGDRYAYLPVVGPFLLAGAAAARWGTQPGKALRSIIIGCGTVLMVSLTVLTVAQASHWKNSISLWSYVIEHEPARVPVAYVNRGLAYENQGQLDRAVSDFSTAIGLDYSSRYTYLAYNDRGVTLSEMGRTEEGLADLDTAIALGPDRHLAYCNRGIIYGKSGDLAQAIADLTKAIELNPAYVDSYVGRGLALARSGSLEPALEDLNKAVALNPYYADAYLNRGGVLEHMGRIEAALSDYGKAVELNPSDYLAYSSRGMLFSRMGRTDEAIADQSRAIAGKPDLIDAYMDRGGLYLKKGNRKLAFIDFEKACGLGGEAGCRAMKDAVDGPRGRE